MAITIYDIADRAGVSQALVWSVLTGRSSHIRAGPETRARIKRIANEVGYRPRSMPAGTAIGVVLWRFKVDQLVQDFWLPFLQGIEGALRNSGFDFLLLGQSEQEEPAHAPARRKRPAGAGTIHACPAIGHRPLPLPSSIRRPAGGALRPIIHPDRRPPPEPVAFQITECRIYPNTI